MYIVIGVCGAAILGLAFYVLHLQVKLKDEADEEKFSTISIDKVVEKTKENQDKIFTKALIEMNKSIEYATTKGWLAVQHKFDYDIPEAVLEMLIKHYTKLGFERVMKDAGFFHVSWRHKV